MGQGLWIIVCNVLDVNNAPCILKTLFVDLENEQAHCNRYNILNFYKYTLCKFTSIFICNDAK